MADELAKAITKIVFPPLRSEGFRRARKRDLIRVENGIVQLLYFQVSGGGGREFCVTACANLVAGSERPVLQPGFRLTRDTDGGALWLPSQTAEEAERSAEIMLGSIRAEAFPFFDQGRTLTGFSAVLGKEQWGSRHHLSFQRGVAAALEADRSAARRHLTDAIELYEADGRDWCVSYIQKARHLLAALAERQEAELLATWHQANKQAHGIK